MKKNLTLLIIAASLLGLAGCYQAHSSDDLRAVPVTNNPNVVPRPDGIGSFIAAP